MNREPDLGTLDEAPGDSPAGKSVLEFVHRGDGIRLDLFLCQQLPGRSRTFIQKLIDENWIGIPELPVSRGIKPSTTIVDGMRVRVTFPPTRKTDLEPEDIALKVLYEDRRLAVVVKPAGLVMHPSAHQFTGTLVNGLLYQLENLSGIGGEERPGIVHRLDRNTSGVVVVAKDDLAHQALSRQFKEREIRKTYLAILRGQWTAREGSIHLPIGRNTLNRKRMMVRTDGRGKEALTAFKIIEEFDDYAFAEIRPHTGRTHQIRVHMAKIRLPVACDGVYGREQRITVSDLRRRPRTAGEPSIIQRQALHASRLEFVHPVTGERLGFAAKLPDDMQALLEALRRYRSRA